MRTFLHDKPDEKQNKNSCVIPDPVCSDQTLYPGTALVCENLSNSRCYLNHTFQEVNNDIV